MIVTHGWPGSIIEQLKIIEPLTDPTAHGGTASDAFDVVIPSLPGYGFSGKPATIGWGPDRIARAWAMLMDRLGYTRYVAQGGDWGTAVSAEMARQAPHGLLGIHVNFAQMMPPDMLAHIRNQDPAPAGLSEAEKRAYDQVLFNTYHRGYGVIMGTRPQTVGYLLADTPVGLAAWLLDHDATTYGHLAQLFAGQPYGAITRDDVLDNTSLYWFTNTATSAARLYWQLAVSGETSTPSPTSPPRGSHRLPRRIRPRAPQLDGAGVPQPDLLQRSRKRRPLRRVGTTTTVLGGVAGRLQVAGLAARPRSRRRFRRRRRRGQQPASAGELAAALAQRQPDSLAGLTLARPPPQAQGVARVFSPGFLA